MLDSESRSVQFPTLSEMTYLNTAAEGIPSLAVGEALQRYFQDRQWGAPGRERHMAEWEAARALVGEFYGLSAAEVGICSCTSEAYNLAALALRLKEGDEVIINDLDFPAGRTPWLQPGCPAAVKVWRSREWALRVEDLVPLLGPRTRLVATSMVSFLNGYTIPLREVAEAVRGHSPALLAVDVTQALGRIPLDLRGVDLIVSSTHKWILSTHGGGLVGVPAARAAELTVPAGGWFHLEDAFSPASLEHVQSKPGAESFTVGMPNFPAVYAVRAALEYLKGVGVEAIDRYARPLVHACLAGLERLPVEIITPREEAALAGILAFRHPEMDRIFAALREERIHVMQTAGRIRVALHGYNTAADVECFLATLANVIR